MSRAYVIRKIAPNGVDTVVAGGARRPDRSIPGYGCHGGKQRAAAQAATLAAKRAEDERASVAMAQAAAAKVRSAAAYAQAAAAKAQADAAKAEREAQKWPPRSNRDRG